MGFDFETVYVFFAAGQQRPAEGSIIAGVVEGREEESPFNRFSFLTLSGAGMGGFSVVGEVVEERPDGTVVVKSGDVDEGEEPTRFVFAPLTVEIWRQKMEAGQISKEQGEMYRDTGTLQTVMNVNIIEQGWRDEAELIRATLQ